MKFGDRIKKRREELGLSQGQVAYLLKVSPKTYSHYENDYSHPDIEIVPSLVNILKTTFQYFFNNNSSSGRKKIKLKVLYIFYFYFISIYLIGIPLFLSLYSYGANNSINFTIEIIFAFYFFYLGGRDLFDYKRDKYIPSFKNKSNC